MVYKILYRALVLLSLTCPDITRFHVARLCIWHSNNNGNTQVTVESHNRLSPFSWTSYGMSIMIVVIRTELIHDIEMIGLKPVLERSLLCCMHKPACIVTANLDRCLDPNYRQISNIGRTLVDIKIVDHSDVVGASPVGVAPTTSSFST